MMKIKTNKLLYKMQKAGILAIHSDGDGTWADNVAAMERFAKLVAAEERQACLDCYSPDDTATDWADKIKARGQR